jgi:hypothetical protein
MVYTNLIFIFTAKQACLNVNLIKIIQVEIAKQRARNVVKGGY